MAAANTQTMELTERARMGEDRRRSRRQAIVSNAWLSPEASAKGPSQHVLVMDLSLNGLGFRSDVQLEVDAVHWLVMEAACLRASGRIRIVSCRARTDGGFDCGAEFF